MKRVLSLRNRGLVGTALMALLFSASAFTFSPFVNAPLAEDPPQKNEQRIKVIVKKDGKETKIDTVFNLPDEKMINAKVDSMLKKFDIEGNESKKFDVLIQQHPGKRMKSINRGENLPGDEQFDILIQQGDSGLTKRVRKIIRVGANGDVISMDDSDNNELLPPPPPPPFMMNEQFGSDAFSFDTNDASIISYDKKDIGKGLEKITIIRKKKDDRKEKREVQVTVETSDDSKK